MGAVGVGQAWGLGQDIASTLTAAEFAFTFEFAYVRGICSSTESH